MDQGRELFEQALAIDPNYASPLVNLAHYYWVNTMTGRISTGEGANNGIKAAERALALDTSRGEALGLRARFKALFDQVGRSSDALLYRGDRLRCRQFCRWTM